MKTLRLKSAALHKLRAMATSLAVFILPAVVLANDPNSRVFPPNSTPLDRSYGEWAAIWWQWALGVPAAENPVLDTTGEFCDSGQGGPVWFLAGTFGGAAERTCTIPKGRAIFLPVHNWIFGAGVFDCTPTVPEVECDVEELRAKAAAAATSVQVMEVTIDGVPVNNIRNYRAASPEPFSLTFPEGAVFGLPPGTHYPHVADGYWLMLKPLKPGSHTITVRAINPDYAVDVSVIYHLTAE